MAIIIVGYVFTNLHAAHTCEYELTRCVFTTLHAAHTCEYELTRHFAHLLYLVLVGLPSLVLLPVLDDGSPTSANLGNDHGFISEEY